MKNLIVLARYSLAFLWLFTGFTSIYLSPEIGYQILENANVSGGLADIAVYAGGILDLLIGIWLLTSISVRICCVVQIGIIALYTILLAFVGPEFWLHPFGPITKNIPIVVLIMILYNTQTPGDSPVSVEQKGD